jgi:hypothetical protein
VHPCTSCTCGGYADLDADVEDGERSMPDAAERFTLQ